MVTAGMICSPWLAIERRHPRAGGGTASTASLAAMSRSAINPGASHVPIVGVHIHSSKAVKCDQLNIQSCLSIAQCE
jgi:hypothetical protein